VIQSMANFFTFLLESPRLCSVRRGYVLLQEVFALGQADSFKFYIK